MTKLSVLARDDRAVGQLLQRFQFIKDTGDH
jgi:hypothetical protein